MTLNYSYPGVYVEELPSGVRTITGVSTSITAFIGRAVRGKVDEPILISSYADFERTFGGLHVDYPISYAVKDFFLNGGNQALIVRLYKKKEDEISEKYGYSFIDLDTIVVHSAEGAETEGAETEGAGTEGAGTEGAGTEGAGTGTFKRLWAANPGSWGNKLSLKIDYEGLDQPENIKQVIDRYGLDRHRIDTEKDLYFFNLTVTENPPNERREIFRNITLHPEGGSRRIDRVLKYDSNLIRWDDNESDYSIEETDSIRPSETNDPAQTTTESTIQNHLTNGEDSEFLVEADDFAGQVSSKTGMYALEKADLFNLLCIPPDKRDVDVPSEVYQTAMNYCVDRRAMLIVDPPKNWKKANGTMPVLSDLTSLGLTGPAARNAAIFFPRVIQSDPLRENQLDTFVPCGIMAGLIAQTDSSRGVWKAPAGTDAALQGVKGLDVNLNDAENGQLNPLGINCLRSFPLYGHVAWGARTLRGADQLADEYKYIPVRRLALYIEESLYRGLKWVVFEPNDEPLWRQLRTNVKVFMDDLSRLGAFQGNSPEERYRVKCDSEINTQSDINKGIVNILVSFAPLKPAEFVVIKLQQLAGQLIGA